MNIEQCIGDMLLSANCVHNYIEIWFWYRMQIDPYLHILAMSISLFQTLLCIFSMFNCMRILYWMEITSKFYKKGERKIQF